MLYVAAPLLIGASVWVTRPIEKFTAYARAVRDGRRSTLPKLGQSEVGAFGAAFEDMKDALEGKEYIERYVQTLTHEIKSPLTAIRGAVELLQEEMTAERRAHFLQNVHTEAGRIQQIVDRLLLWWSLPPFSSAQAVVARNATLVARTAAGRTGKRRVQPVLELPAVADPATTGPEAPGLPGNLGTVQLPPRPRVLAMRTWRRQRRFAP